MKKIIAFAVFAIATSFATANDLSLATFNKPYTSAASVSTSATEATANAPAPSAFEKSANKVGAFLGGLMKGPAMMGKAFVSGVGAGYSGEAAPKQASADTVSKKSEDATSHESAPTAGLQNPLSKIAALVLKRSKDQANAPVEDRSSLASNLN
jgi:hypothetical protein